MRASGRIDREGSGRSRSDRVPHRRKHRLDPLWRPVARSKVLETDPATGIPPREGKRAGDCPFWEPVRGVRRNLVRGYCRAPSRGLLVPTIEEGRAWCFSGRYESCPHFRSARLRAEERLEAPEEEYAFE